MNLLRNKKIIFKDFHTIRYRKAWDIQLDHLDFLMKIKMTNRITSENSPENLSSNLIETPNYLFFCEHNPVFTLGKNGKKENLLLNPSELASGNIEFYHIERGGDITYHGPGQITVYPILDLENFFTDLHLYLRKLENVIISVIAYYGIKGGVIPGLTGVWIGENEGDTPRKIAALGVKCSRWITIHGFALNINTDLSYFDLIIPCNIRDKGVTSIQKETGRKIDFHEVKELIKFNFLKEFDAEID